jgi:hypothetical protein
LVRDHLLLHEIQEENFVSCLPTLLYKGEVETFDDLIDLLVGFTFGKADYTLVDSVPEYGDGLVDFLPAFLAEDFEVGLVDELLPIWTTTMLSLIC